MRRAHLLPGAPQMGGCEHPAFQAVLGEVSEKIDAASL